MGGKINMDSKGVATFVVAKFRWSGYNPAT
jgi:hypothetical protein